MLRFYVENMNIARVLLCKKKQQPLQHRQLSGHFISSSARIWIRARVWSTAYLWIGARVGCRAGAWSSCAFGTEPVLGTRVWREACFWSRVARAREEFEFGWRNARDIMRRTQRIIKPPSYLR